MDCPTCNGNGELERIPREEKLPGHFDRIPQFEARDPICPICNGTGYLEQI